ncbi:MAG: hypothetical protein H0Z39_04235 [Peptococcaceae bacterium]|nr:hypothetical protein [Peptococcaceae bacterium]
MTETERCHEDASKGHGHHIRHEHHYVHHGHFGHPHCPVGHVHKDLFCPPVHCFPFFVCDNRVRLQLGGLTGNLNFQLFRLKGCQVIIVFECSGSELSVTGVVCNVGTDFVDVKRDDGTVVTVLTARICKIEWLQPECTPCVPIPCPSHPCDHPC